jgi:hypothetical protein
MKRLSTIISVGLLSLATALGAACGGGGGDGASKLAQGEGSELLVANPSQALGKSADRFEENVESVEADFTLNMSVGEFAMGAEGKFAYRAPDSLYMTMKMNGGEDQLFDLGQFGPIEMLLLGNDLYMNTGMTGWVSGSLGDFGGDSSSLEALRDGHSPLDYRALIEGLDAKVENLGYTQIFGKTYTKLRVSADLAKLMNDVLGTSLGDSGLDQSIFAQQFTFPITMDILVDPETLLPFILEANGKFGTGAEAMDFAMRFQFYDYNGPVDIPDAPKDAKPFDEALGGSLFGD